MKLYTKPKVLFAISFLFLAGCTVPGSHISLDNEETNQQESTETQVNVYALTPESISQFKKPEIQSTANNALEQEIQRYEYRVGVGDVLNITIWDHPELTIPAGSYRSSAESGNWVHSDGTIFYPYIGVVKVADKSVREIRADIAMRLSQFIEAPQVDVNLAAFRSQKVYVTGEVNKSGVLPITNIPLTLLDAVNQSGGITEDAAWQQMALTRDGQTEQISLYGLMQQGDLTQNRLLREGDILHIPRNDDQKVFVLGEVNDPQMLKIDRVGMSLTEALAEVGGINEYQADATGVFVIRSTPQAEGEAIANVYQLDVSEATALALGTEFELQPYDVVYVTAAPLSRWNRVIAQLLPTITGFNNLTEGVNRVRSW
ncbi:polysaccharide biosynthesis/export family protein [Shewanella electrodiphila]|uniref:Polysaccharide biosynthesis/export family protein n=1 Tax=Shewanella electrodiphila TaxID=934143 RepID=A0ABT0KJX1_9GAMM|nr:polysaccharide export protein [Shewanella electrodiphila]MCL1044136.1 polysaccharide biosynthesis/export family protein [Shewanella electrodiphila]